VPMLYQREDFSLCGRDQRGWLEKIGGGGDRSGDL
jgi:hypothetical protein